MNYRRITILIKQRTTMAIDPLIKKKIEAELRLGKNSRELSEKYDISYKTIQIWKKKIDAEMVEVDIDTALSYDEATLYGVVNKLQEEDAPALEVEKAKKLAEDVIGLQRIEAKTREISMAILSQTQKYVEVNDCSLKELREASGIVTTIHNALFNKNTTQVNVMNNNTTNISSEKLELFKSSLKA